MERRPDKRSLCGKCRITGSVNPQIFRQFHYFYHQVPQDLRGILFDICLWKKDISENVIFLATALDMESRNKHEILYCKTCVVINIKLCYTNTANDNCVKTMLTKLCISIVVHTGIEALTLTTRCL